MWGIWCGHGASQCEEEEDGGSSSARQQAVGQQVGLALRDLFGACNVRPS